jgi:2-amino-4-hydroxy-6-hydroxymethyldihydropteridine diphosphokinase
MSSGIYVGLGSNIGDRLEKLQLALGHLSRRVAVDRVSSVYETEPVGFAEQPLFLNAVVSVSGDTGPFELLRWAKEIESALGRRPGFRNGPRPIDIDILLCGEMVVRTATLTVPHPRLVERGFVLVPLAEIAGDVVEPVSGKVISDLLGALEGTAGVRRLEDVNLEATVSR